MKKLLLAIVLIVGCVSQYGTYTYNSLTSKITYSPELLSYMEELQSQDIPKLQKQLDNEDYHKCIKKANRYAKWHKKNKEVNYYFSVAYFGLINDQNSLYNNLSYLKKSINHLSIFYRYTADRTSKTQQLENALDSTASLLNNNSINKGENYALKRLNKSYKKLSGNKNPIETLDPIPVAIIAAFSPTTPPPKINTFAG